MAPSGNRPPNSAASQAALVELHHVGFFFNTLTTIPPDNELKERQKQIPEKFDIIYLDTIHTANHVEKILYYYFDKLKVGGIFVIDDTSLLPYLKNREKNNFSLEINNQETFERLIQIFNTNHENLLFESSFIGTGAVKLTKLNDKKLKKSYSLSDRKFSFMNLIRKIYLKLRKF